MNWKSQLYKNYITTGMANPSLESADTLYLQFKFTANRILPFLPSDKGSVIIDLGCGSGGLLLCLKRLGYQNLHGVDYSSEQVALANRIGLEYVVEADLLNYLNDTPPQSVDVFILMDVIEHFSRQEIFALFTLLREKIKNTGVVLLHVPNAEGIFGNRVRYGDLTHEMAFTRSSLFQLVKSNGFNSVACFEDKPVPHSFFSFLRRIIWDLGTIPYRLLFAAETGELKSILSQNMLTVIRANGD